MREILFRGKAYVSNEWEYGVPVFSGLNNELTFMKQMHSYDHQVIPETVGQFTGLTDKNGKKIFEGDIVKYKNTDGIKFNGVRLTVIGKVVYNEKTASFAIYGKDKIGAKHCDYFPIKNVEVIGNIHDNPELWEVKDDER